MLPSRPRLERWNPDSLTPAGDAVKNAGKAVGAAVSGMSSNLAKMADTKAWSGDAHKAATAMFGRAKIQTDEFSRYTAAVGDALSGAAGPIGSARTALLNKADEIDNSGQLHVSDQWVVLITGGQMTIEQVAALEKRAQSEQITVNLLLTDVGAADEAAAAAVTAAGQSHGFQLPDPTSLDRLYPGALEPGDEVPNPFSHVGATQQATLRDIDMAQTIRDTKVETNGDITTTTHTMQDGSTQVVTEDNEYQWDRGPTLRVTQHDKDGNFVSQTSTFTWKKGTGYYYSGATTTSTLLADGTTLESHEWPGGRAESKVITPDHREADIPIEILSNPPTAIAGGALTGLDTFAAQGGVIPKLSAEALHGLGAGAKFAGPAVGIAEAVLNVAGAKTAFERCVDIYSGAGSVAGGFAPLLVPGGGWVGAGLISIGGSQIGGAFGTYLGNQFCSR